MKKKIAIIGAGNAGCLTAIHFYYHGRDLFDIELYHDPSAPIERVGQGATLGVVKKISTIFNLNFADRNYINATRKEGIVYENWGKKSEKIYHSFPLPNVAFHYSPDLLSKLVLESGLFNVITKSISDPESEIDSDYIFDCRGRHDRDINNYDQLVSPLNSAILSRKSENSDNAFTRTVATPNGWTFAIPNHDSVSYGYLYNDTITSKADAEKDFTERFDVIPDGQLKFDNYIAKKCFVGERTFLNGNRLSFIEPMEATSTHFYLDLCKYAWDYIVNDSPLELINLGIREEAHKIEKYILWHYQFGSKYDTMFWQHAKSLPFEEDHEFSDSLNYAKTHTYCDTIKCEGYDYSQWGPYSFKNWIDNVI